MASRTDRSRFEWINHVFTRALGLPLSERAGFLARECGGDAAAHGDVRRMLADVESLEGFLEAPACPVELPRVTGTLQLGRVLAGRFRIEKLLGAGGMGEVYEAHDLLDQTPCALKLLMPELAQSESFLERFYAEFRSARSISQRNVCRIHERFEDRNDGDRLVFFTMELLGGPTLAHMLETMGAMGLADAAVILQQICDGLVAIHSAGITHRDLKPGNIMLAGQNATRVVITDFGLARPQSQEASDALRTTPNLIIGSLPYMAPEQWTAREISAATDLYALGLIAFEMVTGARAFPNEPPVAAAVRRFTAPPPQPMLLDTSIPTAWNDAIRWCLQVNPADRPTSARQFMLALLDPTFRLEHTRRRGSPAITRRQAAALAATGIAAVSSSGWFFRYRKWGPAVPFGVAVLFTPVLNTGHDPEVEMADRLLQIQLQQSAHIQLLDERTVHGILARMKTGSALVKGGRVDDVTAREVALRAGAPLVIYGFIGQLGGEYVLQLKVERVGSHPAFAQTVWKQDFSASTKSNLLSVVTDGALWFRKLAGEDADNLANRSRRPEEVSSASWDALRDYSKGEHYRAMHQDRLAAQAFRRALDLDPDFPIACMRLADVLLSLGNRDEAYGYWQHAAQLAQRRNLTDRESLRIQGLFALDVDELASAQTVFEFYSREFPSDWLPRFYLAAAVGRQGRREQALAVLDSAARLNTNTTVIPLAKAGFQMEMGALDSVRKELDRAAAAGDDPWTDQYEAQFAFARGDFIGAWRAYLRIGRREEVYWKSKSYLLRASLLANCGADTRAITLLREGEAFDASNAEADSWNALRAQKILFRAQLMLQSGSPGWAQVVSDAVAIDSGKLRVLHAAALMARGGRRTDARRLIHMAGSVPRWPVYQAMLHRAEGELSLSEGRAETAVREFEKRAALSRANTPKLDLARAYLAARRVENARPILDGLVTLPGRYALEPEKNDAGFYRQAVLSTAQLGRVEARRTLAQLDDAAAVLT